MIGSATVSLLVLMIGMLAEPMGPTLRGKMPVSDFEWLRQLPWWKDYKSKEPDVENWCPILPAGLSRDRLASLAFAFGFRPGGKSITYNGWEYWLTTSGRLRRRRA